MICKRCNVDGNFRWDNDWFDNTGKWRLYDNDKERPHECSKSKPKEKKVYPRKVVCPKCDPQTRQKMDDDKVENNYIAPYTYSPFAAHSVTQWYPDLEAVHEKEEQEEQEAPDEQPDD